MQSRISTYVRMNARPSECDVPPPLASSRNSYKHSKAVVTSYGHERS